MSNLDERQLEDELQTKIAAARVVKMTSMGFFALIPRYADLERRPVQHELWTVFLGQTYALAVANMRAVYHTQPVD